MAGFVRQSAANIQAGQPITAAPLNAEFNALQAAFSGSTGHTHDGGVGNGPKISLTTGTAGVLPIANGGTNATTDAAARTSLFGISTTVDNTVPRFNGITGAIQTSGVVITDANDMSGIVGLDQSSLSLGQASSFSFHNDIDTAFVRVAGGNGVVNGAYIILWGGTHASAPKRAAIAADVLSLNMQNATPAWEFDNVGLTLTGQTGTRVNSTSFGGENMELTMYATIEGTLTAEAIYGTSLDVIRADDSATQGPTIRLNRVSTTPLTGDSIGAIEWMGTDAGLDQFEAATLYAVIEDPTAGSEDTRVIIQTMTGGSLEQAMEFGSQNILYNNTWVQEGRVSIGPGNDATPGVGNTNVGWAAGQNGTTYMSTAGTHSIHRVAAGTVLNIAAVGAVQGSISISGATTAFNAFFGCHWSMLEDGSKPYIPRGTIVESVSKMAQWPGEDPKDNERLPCFKISDKVGSKAAYGVFAWWEIYDDPEEVHANDCSIGSIGAFVIRMAKGTAPQIGDYIESNGDGCGRVQKQAYLGANTVAKITSTEVQHVYDDGSYLLPCTLHCG